MNKVLNLNQILMLLNNKNWVNKWIIIMKIEEIQKIQLNNKMKIGFMMIALIECHQKNKII